MYQLELDMATALRQLCKEEVQSSRIKCNSIGLGCIVYMMLGLSDGDGGGGVNKFLRLLLGESQ